VIAREGTGSDKSAAQKNREQMSAIVSPALVHDDPFDPMPAAHPTSEAAAQTPLSTNTAIVPQLRSER
jgi:hypothetical protein